MRFTANLMFGWRVPSVELDKAMANDPRGWTLVGAVESGWRMLLAHNGGPLGEDEQPELWVQEVDGVMHQGDVVIGWPIFCGYDNGEEYELFDCDRLMTQIAAIKDEGLGFAEGVYRHLMGEEPPTLPLAHLFCSISESPSLLDDGESEGEDEDDGTQS